MCLTNKTLGEIANVKTKKFKAVFHEGKGIYTEKFDFNYRIKEHEEEWMYSVCEVSDSLDTLEVGESIPFKPNRDDERFNGFIIRVE